MDRRDFLATLPAVPVARGSGATAPAATFSPAALGAVGDGIQDDTAALQAALHAAGSFLASYGMEQARAQVDLQGREHVISRPLSWPVAQGITLHNGAITAGPAFPRDGFLIAFQDPAPPRGQPTRLSTFRDVTFDCRRRGGALHLVNHGRSIVDSCFFKRAGTYAIRSVNGTGLSNELLVSRCRFDEWPAGDGAPTTVESTAISMEHFDSAIESCVIGPCRVGIDVNGQFNTVRATHVYAGFRPDTPDTEWVVDADGIVLRQSHCYIEGCYLDQCRVRLINPYDVRVLNNLFYVHAPDDRFRFIELEFSAPGSGIQGVVIRDNGFVQNGRGHVRMIGVGGTGGLAGNPTSWHTSVIAQNAKGEAGGGSVTLQRLEEVVPGAAVHDHGRVTGTVTLDYGDKPRHVLVLAGHAAVAITNLPVGAELELTVDTGAGDGQLSFPRDVRWYGGRAPRVTQAAGRIDRFRFSRVSAAVTIGEVVGQNA